MNDPKIDKHSFPMTNRNLEDNFLTDAYQVTDYRSKFFFKTNRIHR